MVLQVLQRRLLLQQTTEHVGHALWLLKGAVHEGLLVLTVQQAGVSKGIRGGLPLMAPATLWGGSGSNGNAVGRPLRGSVPYCLSGSDTPSWSI